MKAARTARQNGFTIVELLIVIVVIAILATISIVAYNGVQNRANDSAIQSDLSNLVKQFKMFHVVNGRYPTTAAELEGMDIRVTRTAYSTDILGTGTTTNHNNLVYCYAATTAEPQKFALVAASKSGNAFEAGSESGVVSFPSISIMDSTAICPASSIGVMGGREFFYYQNAWRSFVD